MTRRRIILTGLVLIGAVVPCAGQGTLDVPVHVRRLSDRAIVVSLGDAAWTNQTVALASTKGLVVIDTQASRSAGRLVRDAIERAFGRRDFVLVINTHQHYDHTNGNQLYPGVAVVAHDECGAGMRREAEVVSESLARVKRGVATLAETLKTLDPQSNEAKANRESLALFGAVVADTESGHVPVYPTITFSDRLSLDLGDLTVRLYSIPTGHTAGDTVVHVPEEGLLCVGDMIAEGWLPVVEERATPDPDDFLPKWRRLLADAAGTKHVVMGHGFSSDVSGTGAGTLSVDTLAWRYAYLSALWARLAKARADGLTLEAVKEHLGIGTAFPELKDKRRNIRGRDGAAVDAHLQNIETLWRALDRQR